VTIQEPIQVTLCCNLLAPVCQLSSNSWSARMSFSQVQRVFIVEHYLASRFYLTCQNELKDTFPDSPVPNKLTISSVHLKCQCRNFSLGCISNMRKRLNACFAKHHGHFQHLTLFFFSDFNVIYFLTNRTCVRNGLRYFLITLYYFHSQWRD
jgi:hypothetical protein